MAEEYFDIYNDKMEHLGKEKRSIVHKEGYWHKSFQCWFVYREKDVQYILFQKRHANKDTYPNLLDITSAGHLSADESVEDGVRELKEELGVTIDFDELLPIGVFVEKKAEENFIDNEFANVFIYNSGFPIDKFILQLDEVTGIFRAAIDEMLDLFGGKVNLVKVQGYNVNEYGEKEFVNMKVSLKDFVPHNYDYYNNVLNRAKEYLRTVYGDD